MSEIQAKKTPLCGEHEALGAKMVEFAGWQMPVQYEGVRQEHQAVRQNVGLFDVSHMGEIFVRGPQSLESLQWLTSNDVAKLSSGQAQYSLLTNEEGGIVDDIIVYCLEKGQNYLVCVNAANTAKDLAWMQAHNRGALIVDESARWAQIAVQGPRAFALLERLFSAEDLKLRPFAFRTVLLSDFRGLDPFTPSRQGDFCVVARTGYTGEDGVEIFIPSDMAIVFWRRLLQEGADLGVRPVGLAARDTLRTEMKYSLYGHEIDDSTNPYAAGLGWVVKAGAKDFVGRTAILAAKEAGLGERLVGFELTERGIPRQGYSLFSLDNLAIGRVTSGTMSPTLDKAIGIAYISADWAHEGTEFAVDIRGRRVRARVVPTPFVRRVAS